MPRKPSTARSTLQKKTTTAGTSTKRVTTSRKAGSRSSQVQNAGRIKRTLVEHGRPKTKLSAEEVRQLAVEWETVRMDYLRQAKAMYEAIEDAHPFRIPALVRNFWCHTAVIQESRSDPTITREDVLGEQAKDIATVLISAGTLQKVAIDITLLSEGWLSDSSARPLHAMILRDEYPSRPYSLMWRTKVFEKTTHVALEPCLHEIYHKFPAKGFKALFPRLRFCCIQVDVSDDVGRVVAFIREEMLCTLERVVVYVFAGVSWYCSRDAPIWLALQVLAKEHSNLAVLPHQIGFKTEWAKLLAGQGTIWEAELDEDVYEKLPSSIGHDVDWIKGFFGSARWHEEGLIRIEKHPLRPYQDAVDPSKGPTWMEKACMFFEDLALPGALTPYEELRVLCERPEREMVSVEC
ncbi:hypothetical protein DAEQUDRAFT_277274 [Daedalea quercina L-15889]|uniref:Uncharacterized protein n=1 Tax=Daedalea quercina L-15889 TaxID=1314783 RepID=A0A165Q7W9_9APHY|nr:hypothetical protein DAEQUDRAFT_277274 [Daedalea quercina L-15889]